MASGRYVASFKAAEKHRDTAWIADTLQPLRQLEVAATRAHMTQQQQAQQEQPSTAAQPAAALRCAQAACAGDACGAVLQCREATAVLPT